jgi:hypothetical protein
MNSEILFSLYEKEFHSIERKKFHFSNKKQAASAGQSPKSIAF